MAAIRLDTSHVARRLFLLRFHRDLRDWSNEVGAARVAARHQPIAFKGIGPGGAKIELRDVVVAPDASIRFEPIKGQVVIDTRSGEGLAKTSDVSATLDVTKVTSIAVNGKIEVQNQGDAPLVMMMYVVEGR